MSTIFDYLKEVTYDSIYDRPFKELDVLALTELTYLPFGHIVPQGDTTGIPVRLSDAMELIDRTTDFISINDLTDLKQLAKAKEILQNAQDLDPTEREMLERLAKQLIDTRFQAWKKWQTVPRILVQMAAFFKRKKSVELSSPLLLEHKE